jgi:hypothetical protein
MTVKQLIEILNDFDADQQVVIVKSPGEGSPLSSVDDGYYEPETSWYGNVVHPDDIEDHDNAKAVVILAPVN